MKRGRSPLHIAALVLAVAAALELIAVAGGSVDGWIIAALPLTLLALVLVVARDALDQFR
jgi:hypothetical protein